MKRNMTATDARRRFLGIVKGATEKHQVYRIQHPKGSVVILPEDENDHLVETLELLSIPGMLKSLDRSVNQMKDGETYKIGLAGLNNPLTA